MTIKHRSLFGSLPCSYILGMPAISQNRSEFHCRQMRTRMTGRQNAPRNVNFWSCSLLTSRAELCENCGLVEHLATPHLSSIVLQSSKNQWLAYAIIKQGWKMYEVHLRRALLTTFMATSSCVCVKVPEILPKTNSQISSYFQTMEENHIPWWTVPKPPAPIIC